MHLNRTAVNEKVRVIATQNIHYYALIDYLRSIFEKTSKNNILCRNQDMAISPLICWLEKYLEFEVPMSASELAAKPPSEKLAFYDESQSIMSRGGSEFQVTEERFLDSRFLRLANGESLADALSNETQRVSK